MLVPLLSWPSDRPSFLRELMKTSVEKSQFLHLAFQAQAGGVADRGRLAMAEAEVQHLRRELEAS